MKIELYDQRKKQLLLTWHDFGFEMMSQLKNMLLLWQAYTCKRLIYRCNEPFESMWYFIINIISGGVLFTIHEMLFTL